MSNENWIVIGLILIMAGLFALTAPRVAKSKIGSRGILTFFSVFMILTLIRVAIMLYVQYRVQSHTYSGTVSYLSYALYPDLPLALLIPTQTEAAYLTVSIVALILGSFVWAFPLLIFLTRKKP